jgi:hypothetical protein
MARFALRVGAPRPGNPGPVPWESRPYPWCAARAVPVLASPDRPGLAGTRVVGLNLSGVDRVIGRIALSCFAVSGVVALDVAFLGVMGLRARAAQRGPPLRRVLPRRRDRLSTRELDRMMRRVATEATRLGVLINDGEGAIRGIRKASDRGVGLIADRGTGPGSHGCDAGPGAGLWCQAPEPQQPPAHR